MKRRCVAVACALALFVACGSPSKEPAKGATPAASAPAAPTPFKTGTLDTLLAPIALYPDPLLAQMLMSAGTPAKITELNTWLQANKNLQGTPLQDAAVKAGFEPSFVALVLFPQVVSKMAEQIAWTTLLGQSFASDRDAVFASIQKLRQQAKNVGTLKTTPQQAVETKKAASGEEVIVIEPANPQVVYVPQYNPEVVYVQAPSTTTVIVEDDDDSDVVAAGLIGFTAGIVIGASMNNNYYYGPYGWHGGGYMYAEAWDDYYDHREDAREDWMDHREDIMEDRGDRYENRAEQRSDRAQNAQGQRTERAQNRQENRPASQGQGTQRAAQSQRAQSASSQSATSRSTTAQANRTGAQAQSQSTTRTGSAQSRGYGDAASRPSASSQRSSDAFSGYSSGASQRSGSNRGQASRSSSRSGGGGGRRR